MSVARVRALALIAALAVAATAVVVWAIAHDAQKSDASSCKLTKAATTIPEPAQIKVRVLNGTDRQGLAWTVRTELEARGFVVVEHANAAGVIEGVGLLRYGPLAAGSAHLVRAHIPQVALAPAADRSDDIVELLLGPDFTELTATPDIDKILDELGDPVLPTPKCDDSKPSLTPEHK